MIAVALLLNLADALLTAWGLHHGAMEAAPVGQWLFTHLGVAGGLLAGKLPVVLLLLHPRCPRVAVRIIAAIFALVVINNIAVLI